MIRLPSSRGLSLPKRIYATTRNASNRPAMAGGSEQPLTYCRELVRKQDYDSFLASYFYPRATQDTFFALKAFNVELASVRESVSKPVIGQMRMQFWRDAVKSISQDSPPKHPIALGLHQASKHSNLSAYHLKRIIDARDQDLYAPTYATVDQVTAYAESTSCTMLYLLLSALGQNASDTLHHAASHVGIASTISTLLRALPFHASQRRMVIPTEISVKHSLREEDLFRYGGNAGGLSESVFDLATVANDHLITAREMFKETGVPREAMPAFLTAVPASSYLEKLEKVNFDAFNPALQTRDWKLPFRIWRANGKRQF